MRKLILAVTTTIAVLAPVLILTAGASATTATETFSLVDTTPVMGPPRFSVIATGAFVAGGTATRPTKGVLNLSFPAGTITLHTGKKHKVSTMHQTATACIETQTNTGGHFTIAGGTGAYKGITGSGRATLHSTFIEQVVHGQCANAFTAVQAIVTASGPVSLP